QLRRCDGRVPEPDGADHAGRALHRDGHRRGRLQHRRAARQPRHLRPLPRHPLLLRRDPGRLAGAQPQLGGRVLPALVQLPRHQAPPAAQRVLPRPLPLQLHRRPHGAAAAPLHRHRQPALGLGLPPQRGHLPALHRGDRGAVRGRPRGRAAQDRLHQRLRVLRPRPDGRADADAMTETGGVGLVVEPKREWSRQVAIVGVGETDFGADYKAARAQAPGYEAPDAASLALRAFERALTDAGLQREDVDGLSVSLIYGGAEPAEMAQVLGITPRFITRGGGIMAGTIPAAVAALMSGQCDTIALVYAAASRAIGRRFGGATYTNAGPVSYYYYHPWGWSSQAAHWALIFRYYMNTHGATEADLGAVAMTLRRHASINDNAIMRTPLSIEDYLGSRYIVSPLHLFDMCLVNDGGLCIILRRRDMAEALRHTPVLVAGWGHAEIHRRKLHHLVRERLRPQFAEAGEQAFAMAGLGRDDMQHFQGY